MCKTFYNIDLFGKAVLFNYKGSSKSKSKVGAVCTVVLIGFIVWLIIDFGQALFDKSNPKATSYESYNENPAATPITVDNFVFAIGMADPVTYLNFRNDSIFTVYASTYKATRVPQPNGTVEMAYVQIPLEMEPCRADHFGELANAFSYLALDQIYCLNKDQPDLEGGYPILEGQFESPTFQSVYIEFQVCDNDTSTVTCGTQEEINKWLQGAYMSLVFSNMAVDLTDSKTPLQKFRDGYYTTVDNSYYKEVTLSLEQLEINTDEGWLTTNYKKGDYIKSGDIKEFLSLTPKSSFAYFSMRLSNVKQHYNRSYTKIQDIIAQVNGTVTAVFTILFIVIAPYVRLKFYEALINDIFDIKTSKRKQKGKKNKRKNTKTEENSKAVDPTNNLKPADNKVEIQIKEEDLEQQRPHLKTQNDPMLTNRTELTERNYTEDANLMKRWPTFEEASCLPQYNPANLKQNSNNFDFSTPQNQKLVDIKAAEAKKKIQFQHSRGLSGVPLTSSVSQTSQIEIKPETHYDLMISPLASPIESKNGGLLPSRKPTFKQPHFKILDYEEHGQDLFEDILKNIDQAEKKCAKDPPTDDFVISDIRNEEKENLDPQDENLRTDQNRGLPSEEIQSNHEEEQKQEGKQEKQSHAKYKLQRLDLITSKNVEEINLSFSEYLRSYFSKSDAIREKMCILDEGIKRINERLDIFNIFKKLRELDKLKVLLLENEQFVLFEGLPRPQLTLKKKDALPNSPAILSKTKIKDPRFIHEKTKQDLILVSYENLKRKSISSMLDKKLFDIYDDILCLKP